jgi:beta-glucosidase
VFLMFQTIVQTAPATSKLRADRQQAHENRQEATVEVTLSIDPRSLSGVDDQGNRAILPGQYTLTIGGAQPQETDAKPDAAFSERLVGGVAEVVG